jgi:hypothetical protein
MSGSTGAPKRRGVDPILATGTVDHPAYRGQAYLVFDQLFFGQNRTNAPHIEVVAARWPNRRG